MYVWTTDTNQWLTVKIKWETGNENPCHNSHKISDNFQDLKILSDEKGFAGLLKKNHWSLLGNSHHLHGKEEQKIWFCLQESLWQTAEEFTGIGSALPYEDNASAFIQIGRWWTKTSYSSLKLLPAFPTLLSVIKNSKHFIPGGVKGQWQATRDGFATRENLAISFF